MDDPSGNPPTPPYSVTPSAAAATSAAPAPNPSGGADAGNPTAAARALFVPPRGALHAGAAAAQMAAQGTGNARPAPRRGKAPSTKRPHVGPAAVAPPKKAKAPVPRRQPPPPAPNQAPSPPPPPPTQPTPPSGNRAGAHMVDGEMPERVDDAAFMETMNVGSSFLHDDEAAYGEEEYEDVDEEGEGLIEPRPPGRAANYTIAEDKLLCKTWLTIGMDPTTGTDQTRETYWMRMTEYFNTNTSGIERTMRSLRSRWSGINTDCQKWAGVQANIDVLNPSGTNENDRNSMAQGLFRDVGKKNKKGNKILGKPFTLHHCYEVLGNEEKWKTRGKLDAATMAANATGDATIIDDDDSSDEGKKRSSTPHSVNNGRRNVHGRKTAKEMKGRKAGDDDIAMAMERIANARLQANEDRKMQRNLEKEAMDAIEARRAALEERIAANEERKLALEEKRQATEEHARLAEEERKLFLMDTSHMDERQKEYVNLLRDEVLAKKRLLVANMNTSTTGMFGGGMFGGGMPTFGGGMGGMAGMGSMPMPTMGGMAGMGSMPMPTMGGMAGMGGYGGMAGMGGPSYGGVFGGTMGGSVSGVYGSMGAPPGGFVSSMNATIPPSTQDDEEEEEGVDLENAEV